MKAPVLITTLFLALTVVAAKPSGYPPPLPDSAIISEAYISCPGDIITVRAYNLYGSDAWAEARTFSVERDGQQKVVLYFAYPQVDAPAEASKIILIPEGEAPREVTFDELVSGYPSPCQLVKPQA